MFNVRIIQLWTVLNVEKQLERFTQTVKINNFVTRAPDALLWIKLLVIPNSVFILTLKLLRLLYLVNFLVLCQQFLIKLISNNYILSKIKVFLIEFRGGDMPISRVILFTIIEFLSFLSKWTKYDRCHKVF